MKIFVYYKFFFKIFVVTVICILLRLFVFEIYYVPSSSMNPTLLKGDYILVSKLHYGPRLPRNILEVPIINIFAYKFLSKKDIKKLVQNNKPYTRIKAFKKVKPGDIIVFNTPIYQSGFSVKRCSRVPGDTLTNIFNRKIRFSSRLFIKKDSMGHIIIPSKNMIIPGKNIFVKKENLNDKKR